MKQTQVKISFETNTLLSVLAQVLENLHHERDILIPIKATEVRENTGETLVYRHQFDSRYCILSNSTKILIPAQIGEEGFYNIFVFSNQKGQHKIEQIRLVKSSLIKVFSHIETLTEYNKGQKFITIIDHGILLSKLLATSIPAVLIKLIADYFAPTLQIIKAYSPTPSILSPTMQESETLDKPILGTENDGEVNDF